MRMVPPCCPAPVPVASSVPPFISMRLLLPAPSTISPLTFSSVRARTVPDWFTTSSPAVVELPMSITRPPSACKVAPAALTTLALVAMASAATTRLVSPSLPRSKLILRPEASATVPRLAVMLPVLVTSAPISTTGPPVAVSTPALLTTLALLSSRRKSSLLLPARKSPSRVVSASVEATRPPTLTVAPWLNITPFGLTRNTRPGDVSCPAMVESWLPVTRLSRMLAAACDGLVWLMLTASLAPMEKLFQLMIARSDDCEMPSACPPALEADVVVPTVTPPYVV
ncbi:hypothetical protein FQZ97_821050 [compost metagenome]